MKGSTRECLDCGMRVPLDQPRCPKCDAMLDQQHDGSVWTLDIAHHGERVEQALAKLHGALEDIRMDRARDLRLIVGAGLIREAVYAELAFLERRGDIVGHAPEPNNRGAIIVRVKRR